MEGKDVFSDSNPLFLEASYICHALYDCDADDLDVEDLPFALLALPLSSDMEEEEEEEVGA